MVLRHIITSISSLSYCVRNVFSVEINGDKITLPFTFVGVILRFSAVEQESFSVFFFNGSTALVGPGRFLVS
jgi:hypothetical protein